MLKKWRCNKKILKIISEKVSNAGLPTLVFLLIFSVASVIFDILLLKGISQVWFFFDLIRFSKVVHLFVCAFLKERHKLMSPFVVGNYVALGIQTCLTIYNVFRDLIDSATFGDLLIHLILNCVTLGKFCESW